MFSKRSLSDSAWVFSLALAVRLIVLSRFGDSAYFLPTSGDMRFYAEWAQRITAGQWTDHKAFYGLPGYPFFLAGIFTLMGFDPFAVGFLQCISEAAIAVLIFKIATWAFPGPRARIIGGLAALGWTLFQPAQAFSIILMPTTWAVLTFWGLFYWSVRTQSRSCWRPWLGMGLLTGFVVTMVATVLFILPIPLAAAARNLRKPGAILVAALMLLGGVVAGTAPCWVHNYFIAGEPVALSAHSGVNFWVGNNPWGNGYPKLPPGLSASQEGMLRDSIRRAQEAEGRPLTHAEVSRFWSAKAHAYIHEHPKEWLGLMALKVKNLLNAAQYDDLSVITPLSDEGVLTPGLRFGWVAILAIPGLALLWRRWPASRWIAAAVGLHLAALLPVFVTERYRLAAVPGLLLLASGGIVEFWEILRTRQTKKVFLGLGTGIAAIIWVNLPLPPDLSIEWLDTYNSGLKALENGEMEQARSKLEWAFARTSDSAEMNSTMGNYWLHANDFTKAKQFYERALQLDPVTLAALNNLALLEMTEGHWSLAKEHLATALRLEPNDPKLMELFDLCGRKLHKENPSLPVKP